MITFIRETLNPKKIKSHREASLSFLYRPLFQESTLWKCHLTPGRASLHVCLRPAFVRLTAPADNKKRRLLIQNQAIAARQPGLLFCVRVKVSQLSELAEVGMAVMAAGAGSTQLSEAWHSAGPAPAPFN